MIFHAISYTHDIEKTGYESPCPAIKTLAYYRSFGQWLMKYNEPVMLGLCFIMLVNATYFLVKLDKLQASGDFYKKYAVEYEKSTINGNI